MTDQHTSSDGRESPVVRFKPVAGENGRTPPNPVEAAAHTAYSFNTSQGRPGELLLGVTSSDTTMSDAAKLGWVLYFPVPLTFTVDTDSDGSVEAVTVDTPDHSVDIEEVIHPSGISDRVLRLDLQWYVDIPPGTVLQAYPPLNHNPNTPVTPVPSVVAEHDDNADQGEFTRLSVYLEVKRGGTVTRELPAVQVVLRAEDIPEIPTTRELTEEEHTDLQRVERAREIYPDWYQANRDADRH